MIHELENTTMKKGKYYVLPNNIKEIHSHGKIIHYS